MVNITGTYQMYQRLLINNEEIEKRNFYGFNKNHSFYLMSIKTPISLLAALNKQNSSSGFDYQLGQTID